MKKRMLCLFLILSMALCTSAYAVETRGIMDTEDPVTGAWRTTQIQIKNSQGQWEWVDVYDGQGAPVWVETCNDQGELEWVPAGEAPGDGALQQRLKEKKAGLEQRFGVKIRGVEESRTPAVGPSGCIIWKRPWPSSRRPCTRRCWGSWRPRAGP